MALDALRPPSGSGAVLQTVLVKIMLKCTGKHLLLDIILMKQ